MLTVVTGVLLFCNVAYISAYVNDWDQDAIFQCNNGQFITQIESEHHDGAEDRRWSFQCGGGGATSGCMSSPYVNNWDEMVVFICPDNSVITGIDSYHHNGAEDRRFKFRCCSIPNKEPKNCYVTDYANDFDGRLFLSVTPGSVLKGAFSYHINSYEDRRWKYYICDL